MKIIKANLWDSQFDNMIRVIPTNCTVKRNGDAVMGRGVARQAAIKYPELPKELGRAVEYAGCRVVFLSVDNTKFFAFPTKRHWSEDSSLSLIFHGAYQLKDLASSLDLMGYKVVLPLLGCGNGGLSKEDVKPLLSEILFEDKFILVE